jgi:antirestriction protein ArdC
MAIQTYPTPRFLTYKQAKEAGGSVKKGEHGITIFFVKPMVWKDKDDEHNVRHGSIMRSYTVFNVA